MFGLSKEKEEKAIEIHKKTIVFDAHCDRIYAVIARGFASKEFWRTPK
jgi:hypothetical protein